MLKDKDGVEVIDRGDEVAVGKDLPTSEEKKLAEELKAKEIAEAARKKAAGAEENDDDPDKDKHKDTRIPLARHKEILEGERAERAKMAAKLEQYERGADVVKTNEALAKAEVQLVALEATYAKQITDGKHDEAAKTMAEMRSTERTINNTTSDLKTAAAESRAYERARYDTTVDRIEEAYPELNPDNGPDADAEENPNAGLYDAARVRKVLSVARAYQLDGLTPAAALQEAVKDFMGVARTAKQKTATETTARVDDAAVKKAAREEEARTRAAAAAGKQPANVQKVGRDSDAAGATLGNADVMKMSQADFAKLDETTLSRLRGDIPE